MSIRANGLDEALNEVGKAQKSLKRKANKYAKRLCKYAEKEAVAGFDEATVDDNDEPITYSHKVRKIGDCHYRLTISGEEVAFVEYGAGVTKNGTEPYPEARPDGIVGIGQYGKGHGKEPKWRFKGRDGKWHWTTGTAAQMPMYHAKRKTLSQADKIKKEVFK